MLDAVLQRDVALPIAECMEPRCSGLEVIELIRCIEVTEHPRGTLSSLSVCEE